MEALGCWPSQTARNSGFSESKLYAFFLIQYRHFLLGLPAMGNNNMEAIIIVQCTPFNVLIVTSSYRPALPVGSAADGWGPSCNVVCRPLLAK